MATTPPRRLLKATAPTRLDFGGGWTDVPPFPEERGGFVCNLAIDRRATVSLSLAEGGDAGASTADNRSITESPLVAAALRRGSRDGPVPSAGALRLHSDFPVGAGLGGSSAAGVALAAALAYLQGRSMNASAIAEWSRAVEVEELGIAGGRQDHYAAAVGGALGLTFGESVTVESIALTPPFTEAIESRCLLLYTGESRISATTISAVLDAYRDRTSRVVMALDRMKALARQMRDAIAAGSVDDLAGLVDEHWSHQRSLHPGISTARIDALESAARASGATAVKALGASGGGCVIVFVPDGRAEAVRQATSPFAEPLTWRVAPAGVTVRVTVRAPVREAGPAPVHDDSSTLER